MLSETYRKLSIANLSHVHLHLSSNIDYYILTIIVFVGSLKNWKMYINSCRKYY